MPCSWPRPGTSTNSFPADWKDVGNCENGPKLGGHPDLHVYTLRLTPYSEHAIVVVDGMVVQAEVCPTAPPGYDD